VCSAGDDAFVCWWWWWCVCKWVGVGVGGGVGVGWGGGWDGRAPSGIRYQRGGKLPSIIKEKTPHD
jgi:hypothetical protein